MRLKLWYVQTNTDTPLTVSSSYNHNCHSLYSCTAVLSQLYHNVILLHLLSTEVSSVASSVLGCLKKAYTYAHKTTQARVALGDSSMVAVSEFDAAFKKCLKSKLKEEELTREELDRCEQLAGEESHCEQDH